MAQERRPKAPKRSASKKTSSPAPPSTPEVSHTAGPSVDFKLRGAKEHYEAPSFLSTTEVKLSIKAEFSPGLARADRPTKEVSVTADDLIEIEFENGERLWLRGDDYFERFSGSTARGARERETFDVPAQLELLPVGMQARGPISWAVKSLKVLGIDLPKSAAKALAKLVENRIPDDPEKRKKRPGPGLYRCNMSTEAFALTQAALDATESPYLIFIHGTASSTWGSFGDLWSQERQGELGRLRSIYGDRVLAFEHASLTKSPIENALDLADKLPANAHLHLVTHSRGGLVGEMVCRAMVVQEIKRTDGSEENIKVFQPFLPDEFRLFERDKKYSADSNQLKRLKELDAMLKDKQFKVDRFVRVACPALGTTLASGRLDRWFSVIGSLAGTALPDTPLYDSFKDIGDFVAAVIKEKTNPSTLPGLEAMMPDSAFIKLVNWPKVAVPGDLAVIAGDIDPDAWWARMLVWVSDRFYEGDHDLVVNTPSMYGGAKRSGDSAVSFNKGPEVNHFRYFQNQSSAQQMVTALTAKDLSLEGFEPLSKPTADIARAVALRSAEPRPVVFVIPGIMGSELEVDGDHVWLDIPDIVFGGFKQLHIDAKNVKATQPFARYYGDIIEHLTETHKVVPFPYDWRLPVEKEADRLALEVQREFDEAKRHQNPVRILAHSMGGLVARTMILRYESLWREICSNPGARLVMLGTPNAGSHAITELLVAQSSTLNQIAFVDITHDKEELLQIISRFPGILAMLPKDYREDYFSAATWKNYHDKAGKGWVLPRENDIAEARKFRQALDNSPIDPDHMIYVAGHADVTVAEMYLDTSARPPQIKFLGTVRGDGRVTWDGGIPSGVPTWYMNVDHGSLPAHEASFEALGELLERGKTNLLPQTAPVSRTAAALFQMPPATDELYPDEDLLAATVLGTGPGRFRRAEPRELPVQVSVVHGNLAFARHPVAVGHYAGDTIISAEKKLDRSLFGALTQRHQLGIYPGDLETSAVFFNPKATANQAVSPAGAIVIGLGTVGNLSAAALTRTFTRAMLEYVIEANERGPQNLPVVGSGSRPREFGVSALLIGTGAGGISVSDSVFAILKGVQDANRVLAKAAQTHRIRYVEFMELFEDQALQAVKALETFKDQLPAENAFIFEAGLLTRHGGLRRVTYEEPRGWWHRLQIMGGATRDGTADGTLRFSASTRRARTEVRLLATQRDLVDQFVTQSIRTTRDSRVAARTLFELLFPNEIKAQAPDQDDVVLIVDEEAARYPWELLEDRWGPSGVPFVIEHGLLRQLASGEFRESILGVTRNNALVIGDPVSKFPELKGAQEEAKAVARTLQRDGRFLVEQRIQPNSQQVVNALYANAYRVLHLAGHGVFEMPALEALECKRCGQPLPEDKVAEQQKFLKPITGMIIGDGVVLSPKEVHQMRYVPELVFINCCHLGHIENGARESRENRNDRDDYNKIAANVATEFIRMGVRAVIAAGWAVDDLAANSFAVTFYDQMLNGQTFGESVKAARKTTYERHRETNTWGAYQCYGDPDYRLIRESGSSAAKKEDIKLVSLSEAIAELNNIAARLAASADQDPKDEVERIRAVLKLVEGKKWLEHGSICAAFGRAFAEANCFEDAARYYEKALESEDAAVTIKDFEQLANVQSRYAVRLWAEGKQGEAEQAVDIAIQRLESISGCLFPKKKGKADDTTAGLTAERLSLLGSANKRKAWVSKTERIDSLEKMKKYYQQAFKLAEARGKFNPYPLLNWLTAEIVIAWYGGAEKPPDDRVALILGQLDKANEQLSASQKKERKFWTAVMLADAALIAALARAQLDGNAIEKVAEKYAEARKLGSPREYESARDQIDFLIEMAETNRAVAESLENLHKKIK